MRGPHPARGPQSPCQSPPAAPARRTSSTRRYRRIPRRSTASRAQYLSPTRPRVFALLPCLLAVTYRPTWVAEQVGVEPPTCGLLGPPLCFRIFALPPCSLAATYRPA